MKNLVMWLFMLVMTVAVLTTNNLGMLSDGFVNLLLVVTWVRLVIILLGSLALLNDEQLNKFAKRMKEKGTKAWKSKVLIILWSCIGCAFIFWGYWITGIAWIIATLAGGTLLLVIHAQAQKEDF
ncbi:hypothetical protein [Vibrio lentus]|uniref:hypothetical protein n=1 Tax=Vibrio lentus TaxID=136468 RepID=UPI000C843E1D|nr:hypothetical protein [Vibrio lentus]PMH00366.1 hypothetical protein BCU78_15950 [Vibrio lentus]